ncbi:MAG: DNA polymerase I [Firmicutes bacterium]|nr:DNA polymerase I [Bacillota bacterium]
MGTKLILIDGNSLVHRAYYALPPLATVSGQQTNAVYGFTTMLLRLIEEESPTMLAVAFDVDRKTFRTERYSLYKAQREHTPENLLSQFSLVREVLTAFNLPYFEQDGFEADDIIGTLAVKGAQEGYSVLIVTGDKDTFQLVNEQVNVLFTRRGISDLELFDPSKVLAELGVKPNQVPDFKALTGDPSDNIPGVPNIGPKRAAALLQQFGTIENIYQCLPDVNQRWRQLLVEHKQQVLLSRELATICSSVPLRYDWAACQVQPLRFEQVGPLFQRLEFHRLSERIFPHSVPKISTSERLLPDYSFLETADEAARWLQTNITKEFSFLVDEDENLNQPQGVAVATETGTAYIPWQLSNTLAMWLEHSKMRKSSYHLKEAVKKFEAVDVKINDPVDDLLLAGYLLNPSLGGRSIERLAREYLDLDLPRLPEKEHLTAKLHRACLCASAKAVLRLAPVLSDHLTQDNLKELYQAVELPLARVLSIMEQTGISVDKNKLHDMGNHIEARMDEVEQKAYSLAGEQFNLNSPKQLSGILFDKLGLPPKRRTKTGYSTSASVLGELIDAHPIIPLIIEHRQLAKLKSTYVDAIENQINPVTGRIHTTFTQTVTATGRLSSQEPNLQNIPIRLELGHRLRQAFVPGNEGWQIISADYSQIELRVLAHMSKDPVLIESFHCGEDIHTRTAAEIFDLDPERVTPDLRNRAKAVNFGIIYGISDFGLAQNIGVSRTEAQAYIDGYFHRYRGVKNYMQQIVEEARLKGYVTTLLNRRRYLPDITSRNYTKRSFAERAALNTPIQGTAADIIKVAMLKIAAAIEDNHLSSHLLLQVHDELVFEAPPEEIKFLCSLIKENMEHVLPLAVPLKIDIKLGPNWYEIRRTEDA